MNKSTHTVTVTRFYTDYNFEDSKFYVEVSPNGEMIEFILGLEKYYGDKFFMFGLLKEDCPEDTWEELIENNIEDCIDMFIEDMI